MSLALYFCFHGLSFKTRQTPCKARTDCEYLNIFLIISARNLRKALFSVFLILEVSVSAGFYLLQSATLQQQSDKITLDERLHFQPREVLFHAAR